MGCPLCNRKTAILMIIGLAILFLPGNISYLGFGFIILAYGLALFPGKTCSVDYGKGSSQEIRSVNVPKDMFSDERTEQRSENQEG